jgi:hypothetical protein
MRNRSGQVSVELILIMTLLAAVATLIANGLKENKVVEGYVQGPWDKLSGMIENGNWAGGKRAKAQHPNHRLRGVSLKGADE